VTGIPGKPHAVLMGAVNGGVWQTDDDGRTWTPIFDSQPTQSIGAIAVAPSDPRVIYVGSGEGLQRPDLSVGDGIYRSADGGKTWNHLALFDAQQIPELAVDPRDANRLYAAVLGHPFGPSAERGIYRSSDGGHTWSKVLYIDENTGGSSIKIDPHDSNTLYAGLWNVRSGPWEDKNVYNGTAGGLYKSTDGGEHWRRLTKGLPEKLSQIDVAVAPSKVGRLYATVATSAEGDYDSAAGLGIYRSDDGGESWSRATTDPRPALRIGGGDLPIIKVDPTNEDVLYSASIVTMKSTDGGSHWISLRGAPGGDDYQNLWISPDDPRRIALVSDQGAIITENGGATWSSWFNQPTAQLYHIGITPTYPYRICSGQQESGSVCISSRGNDGEITMREWHPVGVIEYGYVVPDPLDADTVYGAGRNVVTKTHLGTGQVEDITPIPLKDADIRTDRTEPMLFSPQDPHRLYYAANRLYETNDAGHSWSVISPDLTREEPGSPPSVGEMHQDKADKQRGAIYSVSASALQPGLLWAGTDDGLIWVTQNDGKEWHNVTPPALTSWSKVTQIEASHFDARVAYASVSRFRVDDLKPYLYRTRDGGQSWQLITAGLPVDAPANAVREDTVRRGLLFAATEKSVWVSFDDGENWNSLQLNLPHTSMRDLAVHENDLIVATHGRSFWILDDIGPLRQDSTAFGHNEVTLLKPVAAVRVRRSTGTDTPIPPDEPTGRNPPDGAVIDYYLAHAPTGALTLEVLDSHGTTVRRVSSTDPAPYTEEELARELIPTYWISPPRPLRASPGMHRFVWDLHYAAPRAERRGYPISAVPEDTPQEPEGPLAVPGEYRIRLRVGNRQWEQPLVVAADPRVRIASQDYAAELALAQRLADALDASTGALLEGRSLQAQLKALAASSAKPAFSARIDALQLRIAKLLKPASEEEEAAQAGAAGTKAPGAAAPGATAAHGLERVNGDIASLYNSVNAADAAPTLAQSHAADLAVQDWKSLAVTWQHIREDEVAALNRDLKQARLATLRLDLAPPRDPDQANEE